MEVPKEKDQTPGFLRFHLKNPGLFLGMNLTSTEVLETELLRLEPLHHVTWANGQFVYALPSPSLVLLRKGNESVSRSVVSCSFVTPWSVARQAPLSMEFSRQQCWNELPFPPPEIFPTQGSNPGLLHCREISLLSEPPGKLRNRSASLSSTALSSIQAGPDCSWIHL